MEESIGFWHSLCLLSKTNEKILDLVNKNLKSSFIYDVCLNAHTIILGAYDIEGYVFWEKEKINRVNN